MMITITTGATPLPLSVGCQELGSGARSGEKLPLLRFSDHEVHRRGVLESGRLPDQSGVRHRLRPVHQLGETVGRVPDPLPPASNRRYAETGFRRWHLAPP
jgi:hypothetical protein